MGIFTEVGEIERLSSRLSELVGKKFYEVARDAAEEIAEVLIDEKGLDDICRDIDDAVSEASDMIHEAADLNVSYDFDNYLLVAFEPYLKNEKVDNYIVKEIACAEDSEIFLTKAVQAYAYELWRVGIENALREVLKEKCARALRKGLARVRERT